MKVFNALCLIANRAGVDVRPRIAGVPMDGWAAFELTGVNYDCITIGDREFQYPGGEQHILDTALAVQ